MKVRDAAAGLTGLSAMLAIAAMAAPTPAHAQHSTYREPGTDKECLRVAESDYKDGYLTLTFANICNRRFTVIAGPGDTSSAGAISMDPGTPERPFTHWMRFRSNTDRFSWRYETSGR